MNCYLIATTSYLLRNSIKKLLSFETETNVRLYLFVPIIMKNKLIAFLLFCSPSLFLGQSKSISGKVFEVVTQNESEPIPFANLALVLANDTTSFVAGEISDLNGGYTFKALKGKRYILKVEYYDVPPIRYMNNAEVVVNILTKPLDSGWNGDFYAVGGMMSAMQQNHSSK